MPNSCRSVVRHLTDTARSVRRALVGLILPAVLRPFSASAVLAVAALTALAMPAAVVADEGAQGQSSGALFQQLLKDPDNAELNLAFGAAAEAEGNLRHALAAYERGARANPDHDAINTAYARLRRQLSPSTTSFALSLGPTYRSNVRQNPDDFDTPDDVTIDGALSLVDERNVADYRFRSLGQLGFRVHTDVDELTEGRFAAWTGPVFYTSPDTTLHTALGGGATWLDGERLYYEGSARLTYALLGERVPQTVSLYFGFRDVNEGGDDTRSDGFFASLDGRFTISNVLSKGDAVFLQPSLRISSATGEDDDGLDDIQFIGSGVDIGGRASYFRPVLDGRVQVGVGAAAYQRFYERDVLGDDEKREDTRLEGTFHLVFPNLIADNVDLRVDYRLENNVSNDDTEDFVNHVAGARVVWRF